jgi:alkylation response protein AidB-like acyl-CoA dehydrogenase
MLRTSETLYLPSTERSGFEPVLSEDERAIQEKVHRFAADVMRPIGLTLDRMTAAEAIAPASPYWEVLQEAAALGLDNAAIAALPPEVAVRVQCLIAEELGWGDMGLAVSIGAAGVPLMVAQSAGNDELVELATGKIGCWVVTHSDRGSDVTSLYPEERHPGSLGNPGSLQARVTDDEIIINGSSSEWISNGAVAQIGALYIPADYGDGLLGDDGHPNGIGVVVPFDLEGVTLGEPITKLGQRGLPQGAIHFNDVRVPRRYALAERDGFYSAFAASWSWAGTFLSQASTGLARAAFELALAYAHEREQGGALLADHQLTQYRLGLMGRGVEATRALSRRTTQFATMAPRTHPYVTAQAKATCTQETFEVVNEALQLFGAVGLTPRHPAEKLLRDARASLIEDGENYVLTMRFGGLLSRLYRDGWTRS